MRLLVFLAACGASSSAEPRAGRNRPADPPVDMACVQHMRDRDFALPAEAGAFHVTAADGGAHLHRDGRPLVDDAEGTRLWETFNRDGFGPGMSSASHGQSSIYTCSDADKRSCVKLSMWICQTDLDSLTEKLATVMDHAGLADAALSVDISFVEARGPSCRDGAACTPQPHYSTRSHYDPERTRTPVDAGGPSCDNDGDCEPSGQACTAWWLGGGVSTAEYRQYSQPTFCGCVEKRCRFFQQPNLSPRPPFPSRN